MVKKTVKIKEYKSTWPIVYNIVYNSGLFSSIYKIRSKVFKTICLFLFMSSKEIDKLVEILSKQKQKYNEKQIRNAILAEGYSEDIANQVLAKIFPKEEKPAEEPKIEKRSQRFERAKEQQTPEPVQETKTEMPKTENLDYYSEVNALINQLKEINKVKKAELVMPNMIKETNFTSNVSNTSVASNTNDINKQIELKKQELAKIKIENDDDIKIITKDGKTINLNDYPRREWRNYRDNAKTIAETKEEQMQKLRQEIYALKKQAGRSQEVVQEEHISEKIRDRVREKAHGRIPETRLDIASKNEAEKLREKYKSEQIEKQDLETAAENIFVQMTKNPNIYDDVKSEDKTETKTNKTSEETPKENKNELNDMSLDTNFSLDSMDSNSSSNESNEFDLGLDLNLDDKKKEKKK